MLKPVDFWKRLDIDRAKVVLVVLLKSWKRIGDDAGMEGIDLAATTFAHICTSATRDSDGQSMLSVSVFAAYWSQARKDKSASDALSRWLPMGVTAPYASIDIEASWFALERAHGETARDLFQRIDHELNTLVQELPEHERHRPLHEDWEWLARD
jgi:hypothetical protein